MKKENILKKIDEMNSFGEKLEYLNSLWFEAKTLKEEKMIEEMIEQLNFFGK